MKIRNLTITAFLIAINVVLSSLIVIPLGPIKAAPVQHFINVLCAVFVGPWYGLAQALISSILRISFGTGSPFAFPGSMIGVLLSSLFYMYRKHIFMASVGSFRNWCHRKFNVYTFSMVYGNGRLLCKTINDSVYGFKCNWFSN